MNEIIPELELDEDGDATGLEAERPDPGQNVVQIERPFDLDKIKVIRETKTVSLICTRIDHEEIDLAPEFQRRARIWDKGRKGRLIESILLRIPLPVFYVASDFQNVWSVVDGLQRMTTIHDFVKGDFPLRGLEYLVKFERAKFFELPRNMQRRIEETELVINVIQPEIPEEVMFNIFNRINTGGITLNSQEIRHALNKGPVRNFLSELVETDEFHTATLGSISDVRMSARECALRFSAFYQTNWKNYRINDLDGFLNAAMKRINEMTKVQRIELQSVFRMSMNASFRVLGDKAFRKPYRPGTSKSPISKPLFEVWSVVFARLTERDIQYLADQGEIVVKEFVETLRIDRNFEISISYATGAPSRVQKRFEVIEKIINGVLEDA